jgi:putative tryptophan/tyrosine transport system substrate-binding protein
MPQFRRLAELAGILDEQFRKSVRRRACCSPPLPPLPRYHLPTVYALRHFIELGGLLSYGNVILDNFRRAAIYADRIFKGAKPSELPVEAPEKFELVINLKTAKALGLTVPPTLLGRADEVIE